MDYNNRFKKGIKEIKKASLSKNEKEGMLARLTEYTVQNPITSAKKMSWFNFANRPAYAFVLASIVIIIGGNISYAAADSLPGDVLYPIKIHVNEKVQGALKVTPKAAARWEEQKIEKRLEEVNKLVEKGKFDSVKREQVEKEVKKNVEIIRKQNNKNRNSDLTEAVDVKLKKINDTQKGNKNEKEEQKNEVRQLEEKIQDELKSFKFRKGEKKEENSKPKSDRQNPFQQSLHRE